MDNDVDMDADTQINCYQFYFIYMAPYADILIRRQKKRTKQQREINRHQEENLLL